MPERYDDRRPGWRIVDSDQSLFEVALIAEQLHQNVPYHNFGHPLDTLLYAEAEIVEYEKKEHVQLPRLKIYKALLLHDIAESLPLDGTPFKSPEHRSAAYAGYILRELNESEADIADIKAWIISTNPDYDCRDDLAKIVRRADLGNTADNLIAFLGTFALVFLEQEHKKFKQKRYRDMLDPIQAAEDSSRFLRRFFAQDLTLGSGDWDKTPDGLCRFSAISLAHIAQLPQHVRNTPFSKLLEYSTKR